MNGFVCEISRSVIDGNPVYSQKWQHKREQTMLYLLTCCYLRSEPKLNVTLIAWCCFIALCVIYRNGSVCAIKFNSIDV